MSSNTKFTLKVLAGAAVAFLGYKLRTVKRNQHLYEFMAHCKCSNDVMVFFADMVEDKAPTKVPCPECGEWVPVIASSPISELPEELNG